MSDFFDRGALKLVMNTSVLTDRRLQMKRSLEILNSWVYDFFHRINNLRLPSELARAVSNGQIDFRIYTTTWKTKLEGHRYIIIALTQTRFSDSNYRARVIYIVNRVCRFLFYVASPRRYLLATRCWRKLIKAVHQQSETYFSSFLFVLNQLFLSSNNKKPQWYDLNLWIWSHFDLRCDTLSFSAFLAEESLLFRYSRRDVFGYL